MTSAELASLESWRVLWERVEYVSAATVLIGVVGEFINDFTHLWRAARRHKRLAKGSTLILIVGLLFELIALVNANLIGGRLVEAERTARVELEQSIAPRHLKPEMLLTSISRIEQRGPRTANIIASKYDFEAFAFASQIKLLVENCGWTVRMVVGEEVGRVFTGVDVQASPVNWAAAWESGNALVVSLGNDHDIGAIGPFGMDSFRIETHGEGDAPDPDADIKIIVGTKPTKSGAWKPIPKPTTSDRKTDH